MWEKCFSMQNFVGDRKMIYIYKYAGWFNLLIKNQGKVLSKVGGDIAMHAYSQDP